jgi:electron transfer flavoprotein beta subunit
MKIAVVLRQTVDLVEELELSEDGTDIEREYVTLKLSEWDEQALEEALLLAEETGGEVGVIALDEPDVEQILYTALAKGAAHATKLMGLPDDLRWSGPRAAILAEWLGGGGFDLVLTGVQTTEDLDGQISGLLAGRLGLPHAAAIIGVHADDGGHTVTVEQELAGGVVHELAVELPAVIGVQSSRRPPRYVPISRIRAAISAGGIEEVAAPAIPGEAIGVRRLFAPRSSSQAEMLVGDADAVAERLAAILAERGIVSRLGGVA